MKTIGKIRAKIRGEIFDYQVLLDILSGYRSDVVEGRFMGAAAIARLHADTAFRADLEAAKAELPTVHAKDLKPTRDCQAEADALSYDSHPPRR